MSRQMTKRNEGDRQAPDARTTILEAALRLFLDAGYDGVSLEQVGQKASLSRQTVYNLFGSKDALFRAVMDRHWTAVRVETASLFGTERDRLGADPADVLRHFAWALLRFVEDTEQVAFTRLVVAESRRLPWVAEEFYRAGKKPIVDAFSLALADMVGAGLLCCEKPALASRQFMGLIQEFIIWPQVMAIGEGLDELPSSDIVIEEAIAMFLERYLTRKAERIASTSPDPATRKT